MFHTENKNLADIVYFDEEIQQNKTEKWTDIDFFKGHYKFSDIGRIKSLERYITRRGKPHFLRERILSLTKDDKGYYSTTLVVNKVKRHARVHVLIAEAFLGHTPCGNLIIVDHRDTNKKWDNSVSNLQIITQRENASKDKKKGSCKSIGVTYRPNHHTPYECKIRIGKYRICLGVFNTEKEASDMYVKAVNNVHLFDGDKYKFKLLMGVTKRGHSLTEEKVLAIRRLHRINPKVSRIGLSKKINVHVATIIDVIKRKSWAHLPE